MTEIIKEFKTHDGLGAMLWKKIFTMCYAKENNLLFEDTPLDWFLIHESDNIIDENDPKYIDTLNKFNNLLNNPWSDIDFDKIENKTLYKKIGLGNPNFPGNYNNDSSFLLHGPEFNKFGNQSHNSIVIHIRRGNAIPENPRYISDDFYYKVLKNIPNIIKKLNLDNPSVFICTDGSKTEKLYKPIGKKQEDIWVQPHLYKNENGEYRIMPINETLLKEAYPDLQIINNLDLYDTFIFMLTAKVLIVGNSSFSQCAGLLSNNMVITMPEQNGMSDLFNHFKNQIGKLDIDGSLTQ